jgi:crotonobetainyl-CoA:carnitine CoA-transferase CaiB-like acyl-CoA transferase
MSPGPLADVRIVAVEQYGAGPWATMQLADLGAEIIKIEDPTVGGDVGRYIPPYQVEDSSLFFESFNRNKRSIALDLRHESGRRVFEDLVRTSDAVFSNLRGDQPAKLGLRYADLCYLNPSIVCCSLTGFGTDGPRVSEGAYDWTLQGLAGWQSVTGEPDGPPVKSGLSLVDYSGGYVAAIGLIAGVWSARREGKGADIDLSLFEVALAQLAYLGTWVASQGYVPVRRPNSAHQTIVPFQNFATRDGWIIVACPKQSLWERLCDAIGRAELVDDERCQTFELRNDNRDWLVSELESVFGTNTSAYWIDRLINVGVPVAPVNDVAAALEDPQVQARGAIVETTHPILGVVRQVASPLRIDGYAPPLSRAPFLGEHTAAALKDLCGYDDEFIAELERRGAFGPSVAVGVSS